MSKPRIPRDEFRAVIEREMQRIAFSGSINRADGAVVYRYASYITSKITDRILRNYAVSRRPRTEKTL